MNHSNPQFDAILFDFDGVLIDSEPLHCLCWADVLKPLGVTLEWEFYRDHCIGIDDREMLPTSIRTGRAPDALAFSADEHLLLAADAHSGDVAVIRNTGDKNGPVLFTMLPTGGSPNAIVVKAMQSKP